MKIFSQPYQRTTHRLSITLKREGRAFLLVVDTLTDAPGTLYRLCAVLFRHDWNIEQADICTHENNRVIDRFLVLPAAGEIDEIKFEAMMRDFEHLLFEGLDVAAYIADRPLPPPAGDPDGETVTVEYVETSGRRYLSLSGRDRAGLLLSIARVFALHDVDILEARIQTNPDHTVRNSFLINPTDARFNDPEFRTQLSQELKAIL